MADATKSDCPYVPRIGSHYIPITPQEQGRRQKCVYCFKTKTELELPPATKRAGMGKQHKQQRLKFDHNVGHLNGV